MAASLVLPRTSHRLAPPVVNSTPVASGYDEVGGSRAVALATAGMLGYVCLRSLWFLQIFVTEENKAARHAVADVTGLALCLPLVLTLMLITARGERSSASAWLLSAVAVVVVGVALTGGVLWLIAAQFLSGAILVALPIRWAVPPFVTVVAAAVAMTYVEHATDWACYVGMTTVVGGLTLAILVWLTRTVRQAEAARLRLAGQSIIAERLRIDAELTRSVTAALEAIVESGERATRLADADEIAAELAALVTFSRQTLTQTRRMLAGYQLASAEAELRTAATLLAGAGVEATVVLPSRGAPEVLDPHLRAQLRSGVAWILGDDSVQSCVIALTSTAGGDDLRFDVRRFAEAALQ
jgi:two-component system, NarL family, sensor histidine kinase DesK